MDTPVWDRCQPALCLILLRMMSCLPCYSHATDSRPEPPDTLPPATPPVLPLPLCSASASLALCTPLRKLPHYNDHMTSVWEVHTCLLPHGLLDYHVVNCAYSMCADCPWAVIVLTELHGTQGIHPVPPSLCSVHVAPMWSRPSSSE